MAKKKNAVTDPEARLKSRITILDKRFLKATEYLTKAGMSDTDIAGVFGLGSSGNRTNLERNMIEGGAESHKEAMDTLETNLTSRMIAQAIGYDYDEEEIVYAKAKNGRWVEKSKKVRKKHNPGSAQMMTFVMTNKFGDNWKQTKELVTKKEGYDKNPADRHRKQIESLATDVLEADTAKSEEQHKLSDSPTPVSS
jgi:hypothetical protein